MNIAIITGASSGLGIEFYKEMQKECLDEIWVIARREAVLNEICQKHGKIKSRVIPLDLTLDESIDKFSSLLSNENPTIKFLFNNAGFGAYGTVEDLGAKKQADMIDLNVKALTKITSLSLKYMNEGSKIINISSIVAFSPVPNFASYSATKAYVMSFSRALRHELRKRKINVTAICPGPMPTEFFNAAGIEKGKTNLMEKLPFCSPEKVAKKGLNAAKKGRAVYTPRALYKFLRIVGKATPHSILINFVVA